MKGKGKGKDKDEEDFSTRDFLLYLKKENIANGNPLSKTLLKRLNTNLEDDIDFNELVIEEPIQETGSKVIFDCLKRTKLFFN